MNKRKNGIALLFVILINYPTTFSQKSLSIPNFDISQEVVFGQSGTFSGALGLYGNIIKNAINLYFNRINKSGGIKGKKLRLISLPDYGNPITAENNIKELKKRGIKMFLGNMGTRSILKILPQIKQGDISVFFPWSGHPELRNPELRNIINGPGLLAPQLEHIVQYITSNIKKRKIAIFHADGTFSTRAANMLVKTLKKIDIEPVTVEAYNRQTLQIKRVAHSLLKSDPKIVVCISTSMPTVRLINHFFENGNYDVQFFGIDSTLFVPNIMKYKGINFLYTSAVPSPFDKNLPIAKQYLQDIKTNTPEEVPNILSFSYYISAAIIVQALHKIQGAINQNSIIKIIENMNDYDLNGLKITFNKNNRHIYGNKISMIQR